VWSYHNSTDFILGIIDLSRSVLLHDVGEKMSDFLQNIFTQVLHGVNWPLVFYVLFGLFALFIARLIGILPSHILLGLLHEVIGLFVNPEISRTSIDGALTVALILITVLVGIYCFLLEVPGFLSIFVKGIEGDGQPIFLLVTMVFMLVIGGILSLFVTRR
jgi:hypothetical protein